MVNINKLKGRMVENGLNVTDTAKFLGMHKGTFYRKIKKGGESFTVKELGGIKEALNLTLDEFISIFFDELVANNRQN